MKETFLIKKITDQANLYWAWGKAKKIYENEDFIINFQEIADFEVDLNTNLNNIANDIKNGTYKLNPISIIPLPKGLDTRNRSQIRQNFNISVRDQVTWIAVTNIIGPILDIQMPFWSFGNRLYVPVWYEEEKNQTTKNVKLIRKYGKYRHASGNIYRTWSSSWPLFRKAIYITIKKMAFKSQDLIKELTEEELDDISNNSSIDIENFKIKYWDNEYWNLELSKNIYWGTLDFSKFYPSITKDLLISNIKKYINPNIYKDINELLKLISNLLDFKVSDKIEWSKRDVDNTGITGLDFRGVPTGLFVAGFLSNIALLDIDTEITRKLSVNRKIAHFRFVDDHVILSDNPKDLKMWIEEYIFLIEKTKLKINKSKTKPDELSKYILKSKLSEKSIKKLEKAFKLDPKIPSPLMTLTLKKISEMNRVKFDIMDDNDKLQFVTEIEHILATEFPNDELKKETRVSWASSLLNKVVPSIKFEIYELYNNEKKLLRNREKLSRLKKANMEERKNDIENIIIETTKLIEEKEKSIFDKEKKLYKKTFLLIQKAIKDNFYKPKIWKKAIDFCRNTGYDGHKELFEMLKKLYDDKYLKNSAYIYLYTTILFAICENLLTAIKIKNSLICKSTIIYTSNEIKKNEKFINNIKNIDLIPNKKTSYLSQIKQLYILIKLIFLDTQSNTSYVKNQDLISSNLNIIWWILKQMSSMDVDKNFIKLLLQLKNEQNNNILKKIALLYYDKEIEKNCENFSFNNDEKTILNYLNNIESSELVKIDSNPISMRLYKWIQYSNYLTKTTKHIFDIKLSEYFNLEIIKRIIDAIGKIQDKDSLITNIEDLNKKNESIYISPFNFTISFSNNLIDNLKSWKNFEDIKKDINIQYNANVTRDIRYAPILWTKSKEITYGLAVLLTQLLSKNLNFNPLLNIVNNQENPYYLIIKNLEKIPISSYTNAIILGCFSTKKFESTFLDEYVTNSNQIVDTDKDPLLINSIDDLEKEIIIAQEILECHHMDIENNKPRQLTPISLLQINNKNKQYIE